jgi:hypothetical protein
LPFDGGVCQMATEKFNHHSRLPLYDGNQFFLMPQRGAIEKFSIVITLAIENFGCHKVSGLKKFSHYTLW